MECRLFNGIGLGCQGMGNAKSVIYISLKRYCSTQGKSKLLLKTGIPLSKVVVVVVVVVVFFILKK